MYVHLLTKLTTHIPSSTSLRLLPPPAPLVPLLPPAAAGPLLSPRIRPRPRLRRRLTASAAALVLTGGVGLPRRRPPLPTSAPLTAAATNLFGGDSRQRTLAAVACSEEDGELLALGRVFEAVVVFISGPFAR